MLDRLDFELLKKACRFGVTTVTGLVLNLTISVGGHEWLGISANITYAVALVTVMAVNFLLMRHFVYRTATEHRAMIQLWRFVISSVAFRSGEYGCFYLLHNVFGWWYVLVILLVQGTGTLVKFFFYNRFIFGAGKRHGES